MKRLALSLTLLVPLLAACERPDPQELAKTTTFELAREHGRYVRINRLKLFAITLGEGDDVILLHGNPASTYAWRFVIEPLAEHFRVHAFDLPGFGFSDKPANAPYTSTWLATFVDAYMAAEGIDKAVVVGNSMGGEVAAEFAALFPGKTAALVLLAPAGLPDDDPQEFPLILRIVQWPVIGPLLASLPNRALVAGGLREAFYDPAIVSEEDVDALYLPLRTTNGLAAFFKQTAQPASARRVDLLRMIQAPTLIIVGDTDRVVSAEISRRHRDAIDGSRLVVWERTGHLPQEEHPARLVREILDFTGKQASGE